MTKIKTIAETILVPMLSGNVVPQRVLSFECQGHRLSVRKINPGLCYIMHRPTGLKVTAEYTGDMAEAAQGFADAVSLGAYNLGAINSAASSFPTINA